MSYGTNAPQGLQPSSYLGGTTWSGQLSNYSILSSYATAIYSGDPVTAVNTGGIGIGVAGSGIYGVFQGVQYATSAGVMTYSPYWPASTVTFGTLPAVALIIDDPNVEFNIQAGTSDANVHTATVGQTDINLNANFAIAAGSTVTGQTGTYLNMASVDTTATLNLKILRLTPVPGNVLDLLYNNAIVSINNHLHKGGTGTAGV